MTGALIVDKPSGPSSHDVVARVRRALGGPRVGHTGTLDPRATGVLPLLVGPATRLARFLAAGEKVYEARIRLGFATDTYDAAGTPVRLPGHTSPFESPADATIIVAALAEMRGTHLQTPPPFSAKKVAGDRAYDLARRDKPVELAPVAVTAHAIDLIGVDLPSVEIRLACSPGFYVRSLAHDLGVRLGCGAHLEALRRVKSGGFGIEQACPLDTIEREGRAAAGRILPPERLLPDLPAVVLTGRGATRAAHGNPIMASDYRASEAAPGGAESSGPGADSPVRMLSRDGSLVGMGEVREGRVLHPVVVLV
jgi:tRNA pseudouridine55 synthase